MLNHMGNDQESMPTAVLRTSRRCVFMGIL
jgi:hypothetical protein